MTELILTTPEQLRQIIRDCLNERTEPQLPEEPQKKYAYSIREAAKELHVSTVTFQSWKNAGLVDYIQQGRKVIIDIPGTIELLANNRGRKLNYKINSSYVKKI